MSMINLVYHEYEIMTSNSYQHISLSICKWIVITFKIYIIQNYRFSIETHHYNNIVLFYFRLVKGLFHFPNELFERCNIDLTMIFHLFAICFYLFQKFHYTKFTLIFNWFYKLLQSFIKYYNLVHCMDTL